MESIWSLIFTPLALATAVAILLPFSALIHLGLYPPQVLRNRAAWVAIILLSWYYYIIGTFLYALLNFRSAPAKILAAILALVVGLYAAGGLHRPNNAEL